MPPLPNSGGSSRETCSGRQSYPPLESTRRVDVAIIGSGLCALTAALELYRSGKTVAVVAPTSFVRSPDHAAGNSFDIIEPSNHAQWFAELGLERANQIAAAHRDAISALQVLSSKISESHFASIPAFSVAERARDLATVEQACVMGKALHGDCWFTGDVSLPFPCVGASRDTFQGKLLLTPLIRALASELQMLGAELYEHSPCIAPPTIGRLCELKTERGSVQSSSIIFASRTPNSPIAGELNSLVPLHSYMIAAKVDEVIDDAIFRLGRRPIRTIWRSDRFDASKLTFRADYFGEHGMSQQHCLNELACYALSRFRVERVEARWSHHQLVAADNLPIVWRVEQKENAYIAAGLGQQELPWGIASGILLASLIQGKSSPLSEILHPNRLSDHQAKARNENRLETQNESASRPYYVPKLSTAQTVPPSSFPSALTWSEEGIHSPIVQNFSAKAFRGRFGEKAW